jgi:hypothetical protein
MCTGSFNEAILFISSSMLQSLIKSAVIVLLVKNHLDHLNQHYRIRAPQQENPTCFVIMKVEELGS